MGEKGRTFCVEQLYEFSEAFVRKKENACEECTCEDDTNTCCVEDLF